METIKTRKRSATLGKYREVPDFPKEIFIDLTSFCNHACVFCANPKLTHKSTMTSALVYRVLVDAFHCGVRDIGLYATGESFLVKNLAKYVAFAKREVGYEYIFLTTNGALATAERVQPVLEAGLDSIKFSISAGTRESYRKIQGRDDFDLVLRNLKWIWEYRQSVGGDFRIYVTMVYTAETFGEVQKLKTLVEPFIDEWDPHPLNNQCGNMPENNELGEITSENPRGRGRRRVCFQPFKGFTITADGLVSACVLDYSQDLIVGDVKNDSLTAIWESEIYRAFRRRHLSRDLKGLICYNCMNNADEPVTPLMAEHARKNTKDRESVVVHGIIDNTDTYMDLISENTKTAE
jgi:MoaA/NifB/PqqE/SkfB family radical SAM enzyme